MDKTEKAEQVVAALTILTDRGDLVWEELTPDSDEAGDIPIDYTEGTLYVSLHQGMELYLFSEGVPPSPQLEVVDTDSDTGWSFPEVEGLQDLHDLVQFRHSSLESWMDEVIEAAEGAEEASSDDSEDETPMWGEGDSGGDGVAEDVGEDGRADADAFEEGEGDDEPEEEPDVFGMDEDDEDEGGGFV